MQNTEVVYIDEKTNKKLLRKINIRLLQVMIMTYLVQGLDKGVISFASIMGLIEDTGLVGQQHFGLPLVFILPFSHGNFLLIQRVPIAKFLSFKVMVRGIIVACQAATHNFAGLVVCRPSWVYSNAVFSLYLC